MNQPRWLQWVMGTIAVVAGAAGVAMTIASGGRADTPLVAMGPIAALTGIGIGVIVLVNRHGRITVDETSYSRRGGIPTKTTTLVFADAAMVRGGTGDYLGYVVVTDRDGQKVRVGLQQGPTEMRQLIASRLLASGADIDPECRAALELMAGQGSLSGTSVGAGWHVRLTKGGRLRWRRGSAYQLLVLVLFGGAGIFCLLAAAPGVNRAYGLLPLAVGLLNGVILVRGRIADRRAYKEQLSPEPADVSRGG